MDSGQRLDTMEGYNDLYGDEEDSDDIGDCEFKYGASDDEEDDNNERDKNVSLGQPNLGNVKK